MRKAILLMLLQSRFYKWFIRWVVPRFELPGYRTIRGPSYKRGYYLLRPGHIVLATNDGKPFTKTYKGFKHAAFCVGVGPDCEYEIAEMCAAGYTKSQFYDLCAEASRVVIIECVDFSDGYIMQMIEKCKSFEGCAYDVEFTLGVEALYCSELVYQSDFKRILDVNLDDLLGLGRPYVSPQDLFEAKNVKVVWDSNEA